ncbi:MFS transporter [Nostocoides vanveenii]|uniref:Major facilitator superfamily (MFS) profile domain-containing protein n=1 Tax=Nostocoides vanveenii TaxID=330835 RepID=A0ABN2KZR8_9MICO
MRARLLVLAAAVAMLGWGAVLPYQYAYAASARGWGGLVAAGASTLFSVGALIAAPVGGRLADRFDPVRVAVVSKLLAVLAMVGLVFANSPAAFLFGMFAFGAGITAATAPQAVLVLRWVGDTDRRRVFAWLFTGGALGMALGAFAAGYVVDLTRPNGMRLAFATAAAGFAISALLIAAAGYRAPAATAYELGEDPAPEVGGLAALRAIWAVPALRWTAVVTVALALGFYAQFESGLPAYALTSLQVSPRTVGTAAAVNSVVIIALQMVVVRLTARRSAPLLLTIVGGIWTLGWLMLAAARLSPELASAIFVTTFAVFAVGETMYAPILSPLTASLAPEGMVGTTLGVFTALQTGISALGPLVAGVLLGAGLTGSFLVLHIAISVVAVAAGWRLRGLLAGATRSAAGVVTAGSDSAHPAGPVPATH